MMADLLSLLLLGAFWGLSPTFYKFLAMAEVPVTHVMTLGSLGLGCGLWLVGVLRGERTVLSARVLAYGLLCGFFLNVPFALQLVFARYIGPAEMSIIQSTMPFFGYLLAIATRRDRAESLKLLALVAGFAGSMVLVVTRDGISGGLSWWTVLTFTCPMLYAIYLWWVGFGWPADLSPRSAGMLESFASGLMALPFLIALQPVSPTLPDAATAFAYWPIAALVSMWIFERLTYFGLIRKRGSVFTSQAIYIAPPAGVIFSFTFFGQVPDSWLLVSLALILLALWLNDRAARRAVRT